MEKVGGASAPDFVPFAPPHLAASQVGVILGVPGHLRCLAEKCPCLHSCVLSLTCLITNGLNVKKNSLMFMLNIKGPLSDLVCENHIWSFSFQAYDGKDYRKIRFVGRQKEVSKRSSKTEVSFHKTFT